MKLNWPKLVRTELLPRLSGFAAQGRLLYQKPVGDILRAFSVEVSAFGNNVVYVENFVMPLFIPRRYLSFGFGRRLRDPITQSEGWEVKDNQTLVRIASTMSVEGVPFLNRVSNVAELSSLLETELGSPRDPHTLEALGYSQLLAGHEDRAKHTLATLGPSLDDSVEWEREMARRVSAIFSFLEAGDIQSARSQLTQWRDWSLASLKIG